jgi:hypothetical protein
MPSLGETLYHRERIKELEGEEDVLRKRCLRLEAALRKIARSDEYKGADSVATKLGRAMDIARRALQKSEAS